MAKLHKTIWNIMYLRIKVCWSHEYSMKSLPVEEQLHVIYSQYQLLQIAPWDVWTHMKLRLAKMLAFENPATKIFTILKWANSCVSTINLSCRYI